MNKSRNFKQHLVAINIDTAAVPVKPAPELDNVAPMNEVLELVSRLQPMFEGRAMWTRRAIVNHLGKDSYSLKFALPYVAYTWKQGPWRDLYARFGYDPRQDVDGAMFQSIYFTSKGKEEDDKQYECCERSLI